MSMKKGFCIRCITKDAKHRIFTVNSEAEKCYCPRCMKEYTPKEAIGHFNHYLAYLTNQADMTLQIARRPDVSYQKYAEVLEYDNDYVPALLGRISSLIYQSTLRHSRFDDALLLIDLDIDRFHLVSSRAIFINFLKSANEMATSYEERIYRRLTFKGYFYDVDCVRLYLQRLLEVTRFKAHVKKELEDLNEKETSDLIASQIEQFRKYLHNNLVTISGIQYQFDAIEKDKTPSIKSIEGKIHTGVERFTPKTLNETDKKHHVIKDVVFKSNKTAYHVINLGLGFAMGIGTLGLILVVLSLFMIGKPLFLPLLIIGLSFNFIGLVFLLVQFILRRKIKKSRY